jgi:hypothetical protein
MLLGQVINYLFEALVVAPVKGHRLPPHGELHLNNAHLPKLVGGVVHHLEVKSIKLWEDLFAFGHNPVGGLSVRVKANELYRSAFKEKREDLTRCVAAT